MAMVTMFIVKSHAQPSVGEDTSEDECDNRGCKCMTKQLDDC